MISTMHRSLRSGLLGLAAFGLVLASASSFAGAGAGARKPGGNLASEAVEAHNRERKKAGVPPLTWDGGLARMADAWARKLCVRGKNFPSLNHRPRKPGIPGENLWAGGNSEKAGYSIDDAVKSWTDEVRYFDAKSGQCKGGVCGHYTQVVWRDTTHVGCGVATCPAAGMTATVWVCNYRPAGNVIGERPF